MHDSTHGARNPIAARDPQFPTIRSLPRFVRGVVARRIAACTLLALAAGCGGGGGDTDPDTAALAGPTTAAAADGSTIDVGETRAPAAPPAATAQRTPAPPPVAEPPPPPPPPRALNSVDTVVADMRGMNDAVLRGYEDRKQGWYVGPGSTQMGDQPRSSHTGEWFRSQHPGFANDEPMRAILPWLVVFDGVDHRADNTRVHVRGMRAWYLSRSSGEWRSYGVSPGVSGSGVPKHSLFGSAEPEDKRVNEDGSVEIRPPSNPALAWHGWWNLGRVWIDPNDIAAVFVTLQARLVVDDARRDDDRARAQLMVQVGADYYPDLSRGWPGPNPAVGTSRTKRVTEQWQAFNMMTFSDVGLQDPGGGITEARFRATPPPLE